MSISQLIRVHIQSNVVGYVAIFLFAIGGTAYAVDGPLPGQNQVGSEDIIDSEVTSADIGRKQVKNQDLGSGAVSSDKLADDAITSAQVAAESLGGADLAADSITGDDVDESRLVGVDAATLGGASLADVQLRVGQSCSVGESIRAIAADGSVTCEPDDVAAGGTPTGPAGGALAGSYPNPAIAANAVGIGAIGTAAVGSDEIYDQDIRSWDIAPDAVGSSELQPFAVHTEEINTNAVDSRSIGTAAVGSDEILDQDIHSWDIAAGGVGSSEVADGSLSGTDIDESSLDASTFTTGRSEHDLGESSCTVETVPPSFTDCAGVTMTFPRPGRALILSSFHKYSATGSYGICRLEVDDATSPIPHSTELSLASDEPEDQFQTAVTTTLSAGSHRFELSCSRQDGTGEAVVIQTSDMSVLMIGSA